MKTVTWSTLAACGVTITPAVLFALEKHLQRNVYFYTPVPFTAWLDVCPGDPTPFVRALGDVDKTGTIAVEVARRAANRAREHSRTDADGDLFMEDVWDYLTEAIGLARRGVWEDAADYAAMTTSSATWALVQYANAAYGYPADREVRRAVQKAAREAADAAVRADIRELTGT